MTPAIVDVINSGLFSYVNLHYHYIGNSSPHLTAGRPCAVVHRAEWWMISSRHTDSHTPPLCCGCRRRR